MSHKCAHKVHKQHVTRYRLTRKLTEELVIEQGWNHNRHIWEICDSGLFVDPRKKKTSNKRPHSQPRETAKKNNKEQKAED